MVRKLMRFIRSAHKQPIVRLVVAILSLAAVVTLVCDTGRGACALMNGLQHASPTEWCIAAWAAMYVMPYHARGLLHDARRELRTLRYAIHQLVGAIRDAWTFIRGAFKK